MRSDKSRALFCGMTLGVLTFGSGVIAQEQSQTRPQERESAPAFVSIETLNDAVVVNAAGTELASIEDLIVDMRNGRTAYAVIQTQAVQGLDRKICLVPYGALAWDPQTGQYRMTSEAGMLRTLPPFDANSIDQLNDETWMSTLRGVFGERREFDLIADAQKHDEYTWLFKEHETKMLRGEVAAISHEARSAMGHPYLAVVINPQAREVGNQPMTVLLAPNAFFDEQGNAPQEGESITINAVHAVNARGEPVYVAKSATVAGKSTLHLREDSGAPRWLGDDADPAAPSGGYLLMASELPGGTLISADGEEFGSVSDVVFEARSGDAAYAIVSVGGLLGVGDTEYAVPCGSFIMTSNGNLYSNLPLEKLKLAPKLSDEGVKDLSANEFRNRVRDAYGVSAKEHDTARSTRWMQDDANRERRERN